MTILLNCLINVIFMLNLEKDFSPQEGLFWDVHGAWYKVPFVLDNF